MKTLTLSLLLFLPVILFSQNGVEIKSGSTLFWRFDGPRLESYNSGSSLFLGELAGVSDDLSDNRNTFIGYKTGIHVVSGERNIGIGPYSMYSTGSDNIAIGYEALRANSVFINNIAIGSYAGRSTVKSNNVFIGNNAGRNIYGGFNTIIGNEAGMNTSGVSASGNVFIGYQAGYFEDGSDKLYIDNSDTSSPLIYGDFNKDSLKVNGSLSIGGAFTFPMSDGSIEQVMKTDGNGNLSWMTPIDNVDDSDADPSNELQTLSLSGNELLISGGNMVSLPNDAPQTLSLSGNELLISGGNMVSLPNNAPQTLSTSGNDLMISNGNTVTLPSTFFEKIPSTSNDIQYSDGLVGIGTIEPASLFHVNGFISAGTFTTHGITSGNKTGVKVVTRNLPQVSTQDSIIGIRTKAYGSKGHNIALLAEANGDGLAGKFDGKVVLGNNNKSLNEVVITPASTNTQDSSSLYFTEGQSELYGMKILYDGVRNDLRVIGQEIDDSYGPHLTIARRTGEVTIGPSSNIVLDPDINGDSRITTDELSIRGGSDLAELFEVEAIKDGEIQAGMVVSIDPENPGKLTLSTKVRDRLVAGIVSGANGIKPGMMMGQEGTIAYGNTSVSLVGRVYVKACQENGRIVPGDFLTTSSSKGIAMKVKDISKAQGSILGKAMTGLDENGFVLVLINLQ